MSNEVTKIGRNVSVVGNAASPFVYFDAVANYGVEAQTVIIELAATTILTEAGQVRPEILSTGHLRTSLQGLASLKHAIAQLELMIAPTENPDGPKN